MLIPLTEIEEKGPDRCLVRAKVESERNWIIHTDGANGLERL